MENMSKGMNATGSRYWCTVCNAVHQQIQGSEEYVTKTGWSFVKSDGGEKLNIGFCNGVHSKGRTVHMFPASVMPAFEART